MKDEREELKERILFSIQCSLDLGERSDVASWGSEEGVLITINEAREFVHVLEELKHSRNWEKEQHERHTETVNDLLKQREEQSKKIQELLEENKRLKESFTPSIPPLCVCKKKESSSVVTYCDGNCL